MKKIFPLIFVSFLIFASLSLYFLDKQYFISPIAYKWDMLIRTDIRGDGVFGAPRNGSRLHQGVDLLARLGTPVLAARSGIVVAARSSRGMGNYVIIAHRGDIKTIYGHLLKISVREGSFVRQGQLIGLVGKTGNANHRAIKPHLHFEVRKSNVPQDPLRYLD